MPIPTLVTAAARCPRMTRPRRSRDLLRTFKRTACLRSVRAICSDELRCRRRWRSSARLAEDAFEVARRGRPSAAALQRTATCSPRDGHPLGVLRARHGQARRRRAELQLRRRRDVPVYGDGGSSARRPARRARGARLLHAARRAGHAGACRRSPPPGSPSASTCGCVPTASTARSPTRSRTRCSTTSRTDRPGSARR